MDLFLRHVVLHQYEKMLTCPLLGLPNKLHTLLINSIHWAGLLNDLLISYEVCNHL